MNLRSEESELKGQWIVQGNIVLADETCKRIDFLIKNILKEVKTDESGWNTLYQDNQDKRFWEYSYPQSEMHGGGPPSLKVISEAEAKQKYEI